MFKFIENLIETLICAVVVIIIFLIAMMPIWIPFALVIWIVKILAS